MFETKIYRVNILILQTGIRIGVGMEKITNNNKLIV